jgi:hypothetical protein
MRKFWDHPRDAKNRDHEWSLIGPFTVCLQLRRAARVATDPQPTGGLSNPGARSAHIFIPMEGHAPS